MQPVIHKGRRTHVVEVGAELLALEPCEPVREARAVRAVAGEELLVRVIIIMAGGNDILR